MQLRSGSISLLIEKMGGNSAWQRMASVTSCVLDEAVSTESNRGYPTCGMLPNSRLLRATVARRSRRSVGTLSVTLLATSAHAVQRDHGVRYRARRAEASL
jgi:hypothetical protein